MDRKERDKFIQSLIGKRYVFGANGPDEFDCYGLVAYLNRHCMGYALPEIDRTGAEQTNQGISRVVARNLLNNPERGHWSQLKDGAEGDGDFVLMGNIDGRNYHIGMAVFLGRQFVVVHAEHPSGVIYDDVPSLQVKGYNKINFFRRVS